MRFWLPLIVLAVFSPPRGGLGADSSRVDFVRDIQPIFERNCVKCHGSQKQQGGLRFDSSDGAMRNGDSGLPAVMPGKLEQSELIRRIEAADTSERMPPDTAPLAPELVHKL